jgi:low temperature requirement protein LtrA
VSVASASLRRSRDGSATAGVTPLELFYDLVFVFAITQVSHLLLDHLTWEGVGQSVIILLAVWWSWNFTTWATNELDPDAIAVRIVLIGVMLLSLLASVAIPEAFGDKGLLFAGCYVAIQVGRHSFLTFAAADRGSIERDRAMTILIWFVVAGVFWIAGGIAEGEARTALWIIALLIDYTGPMCTFWVPGHSIAAEAWDITTEHFTERFGLFVIIALGETIVITGAATSELELDTARVAAFATAFLVTATLWWLYFDYVQKIARARLEAAENRILLARDAYTYLHVVIIAGIIVSAVGDELVIAHPSDELPTNELLAVVAGPALYLLAHVILRLRVAGTVGTRKLAGAGACVLVGLVFQSAPALLVAVLLLGVLIGTIVADELAALGRRRRGEPSPLEAASAS